MSLSAAVDEPEEVHMRSNDEKTIEVRLIQKTHGTDILTCSYVENLSEVYGNQEDFIAEL